MADAIFKFMDFASDEFDRLSDAFFGSKHKQEPFAISKPSHHIQYCGHGHGGLMSQSSIIMFAGISGGVAVSFAAYGAHFVNDNPDLSAERKRAMKYANNHHFYNTIGMFLAAMASSRPKLTAALFALGTILFCGPSYAYAIRADRTFRHLTPIGGVLAMLAWFSFMF